MKNPGKDRCPPSGSGADKKHQDELLHEALKESFPASDPAAIDIETLADDRIGKPAKPGGKR
jgi:hypothetical protein